MAASYALSPSAFVPEAQRASASKLLMSSVRPVYDDHFMAPFPRDRKVDIAKFLRPDIAKQSDNHGGLLDSNISLSYEADRYVIPTKFKIYNGDRVDAQGLGRPDIFLAIDHLCWIDQELHLRRQHGFNEFYLVGNHDQTVATLSEEGRRAGLNIFEAVRTRYVEDHTPKPPVEYVETTWSKLADAFRGLLPNNLRADGTYQRDVLSTHIHQAESDTMVTRPTQMAAGVHDDLASKGTAGASFAKFATRWIVDGLGFHYPYRHLSYEHDADLETGHVHLVKRVSYRYRKISTPSVIKRDLADLRKTAILGVALWAHRTGGFENIIRNVLIPELKAAAAIDNIAHSDFDGAKRLEHIFRRGAGEILAAARRDYKPDDLRQFKNIGNNLLLGSLVQLQKGNWLQDVLSQHVIPPAVSSIVAKLHTDADPIGINAIAVLFKQTAEHALHVLESDPKVSFGEGLTLDNMRPKFYGQKLPARKTPSGAKYAMINTYGVMGPNDRATFGVTFADTGETHAVDWLKAREVLQKELKLPAKPLSGNDLVVDHILTYGGFRRETLDQYRLYMDARGIPTDDVALKYAQPPKRENTPVVTMHRDGTSEVTTPDGRPLVQPQETALLTPFQFMRELEVVDMRSAKDLRERLVSDMRLSSLFAAPRILSKDDATIGISELRQVPCPGGLPYTVSQSGRPAATSGNFLRAPKMDHP